MRKRDVVRVKPKTFDADWRADLLEIGITVPKTVPETRYTPVNHDPIPFSIAVDLATKRVVRRIVGVMPNACYRGHIYSWDEFLTLLHNGQTGAGRSNDFF